MALTQGISRLSKASGIEQPVIAIKTIPPIITKGKVKNRLNDNFAIRIVLTGMGKLFKIYSFCPSIEIDAEVGTPIPKHIEEKHIYIVTKNSAGKELLDVAAISFAPIPIEMASTITMIGPIIEFIR